MTKTVEELAKAYVESADTWSYGCEENHDITEQMQEPFKAGANHVYGLLLPQRLTAEEKERVRKIYYDAERGVVNGHYDVYPDPCEVMCVIFGKDFFKEEE